MPNQAQFGPKYFLMFTLLDFKSKILTQLSEAKKEGSLTLFNLMGQCFQVVGLTKWTKVVGKQCPNKKHCTKENFVKCIRDYLEAVAGFPNIGNQLICWLFTAKKPAFMPMHKFIQRQVQLLSYLDGGYILQTMDLPTAQENRKQIFFAYPKAHQYKFTETNKMVPRDLLWLITFFEQCQTADKAAGVLDKIKEKKQPKEKKTAHLPIAHSCNSSYRQHCCKNCDYHQCN
jgi:hypothetical protein